MYKKQLKLQKIVCWLCVITAALCFVYALGMITDIHDALISTMRNPQKPTQTQVDGSWIYYDMQPFNQQFVSRSLILVVLSVFIFLISSF